MKDFLLGGAAGGRLVFSLENLDQVGSIMDNLINYFLPAFFFCFSFSNIVIANIAMPNPIIQISVPLSEIPNIAMPNPIIQISVPLSEILEFINPVKPFATASKMKQRHITNAILEPIV